jgi:drug/metabolite transporter (DMT)-like permease
MPNASMPPRNSLYIKLILVALFWAGTFISTRVASQVFGPFTGAFIRYAIALMFLLPLAFKQNPNLFRVDRKQLPILLFLGFTGIFAYNFFFFKGLKTVPASRGALLVGLNPTIVMITSAIFLGEKITPRKLFGILISMIGVTIVISRGQPLNLLSSLEKGDLFMLGCPITWALYTLAGRSALKHTTPLQASTWASLSGALMLLLFIPTEPCPQQVPWNVWLALAYLGVIGTVVAFVWYYDGIRTIGATQTSIFTNLIPVFAVLLSVIILKEKVSWYTWIGGLLVVGGVLWVNLPMVKKT